MQFSLTTTSKADKKSSAPKTAFFSCQSPEDKTGAPAGLPVFLQRLAWTPLAPPLLQRQPIDDEEEELLQPKSAGAEMQVRSHEEPGLPVRQPLKEAILQRQIEPEAQEAPIQPKPAVSKPDDIDEQEANRVADQILNGGPLRSDLSPPRISRHAHLNHQLRRKTRSSPDGDAFKGAAPWQVANELGTGTPLDTASREFFEPRFGSDFANVRIHTGSAADRSARAINAKAYTVGQDIVFSNGTFAPGGHDGQLLLAHELTHVIQQAATPQAALHRFTNPDPLEQTLTRAGVESMDDSEIEGSIRRVREALSRAEFGTLDYDGLRENLNTLQFVARGRNIDPVFIEPGADTITAHDGMVLTNNPVHIRRVLENIITQTGESGAEDYLSDFAAHLRSHMDVDDPDRQFAIDYYEMPSQIPGGVPLPPEDMPPGNPEADLAIQILSTMREQFDILRRENEQFIDLFEQQAMDVANNMLDVSEQQVVAEIERYGLTQETVWTGGGYMGVGRETRYGAAANEQTEGLAQAAGALAEDLRFITETQETRDRVLGEAYRRYLQNLNDLDYDLIGFGFPTIEEFEIQARSDAAGLEFGVETALESSEAYGMCMDLTSDYEADVRMLARLDEIIADARIDYELARHDYEGQYPILAAFTEEGDPQVLERLASSEGGAMLAQKAYETQRDIHTVREALREGDQSVWLLPRVVNMTKPQMGVIPGSMRERVIQDKIEDEEPSWLASLALAVFTIAAGIILAIPSGGTSLAVSAAVLAGELSLLALDAYLLYGQIEEYNIAAAATGTDFNAARAISSQDPSLFWLVVGIIGTAVGAVGAARAFRTVARAKQAVTLARNADEAAEAIARLEDDVRRIANEFGLDPEDTLRRVLDDVAESSDLADEAIEAAARGVDEAGETVEAAAEAAETGIRGTRRVLTEARRSELERLRGGDRWTGGLEAEWRGLPEPPDGYHWRFPAGADPGDELRLALNPGSRARGLPPRRFNPATDTFELVEESVVRATYRAAPRVAGSLDRGTRFRMPGSMRRRLERLVRKRERLRALRDVYEELGEEASATAARARITRVSEHLGEEGAERWMRATYGSSAEKVFGDIASRGVAGEFDQLWRVRGGAPDGGDLFLVIEAKGGSAGLGTRRVAEQVVQQGTRAYFDDILRSMRTSGRMDPDLAVELSEAMGRDALRYLDVRTPIRTRGGAPALSDITVREFDIGSSP
jgi:hypothetical protein